MELRLEGAELPYARHRGAHGVAEPDIPARRTGARWAPRTMFRYAVKSLKPNKQRLLAELEPKRLEGPPFPWQ